MAQPNSQVPRGVFDVSRPGKTPANPSGKPIIVSQRPMVRDSSMTVSGAGQAPSPKPRQKIQIRMDGEIEHVPDTAPDEPVQESIVARIATPAKVPTIVDEPELAPPEPAASESETIPPTTVPADGVAATPELDQHAEPTGPFISQRSGSPAWVTVLLITLVVFLAVVIVDILLDASILSLDSLPHTNFFN